MELCASGQPLADHPAHEDRDTFWAVWEGHRQYLFGLCRRLLSGRHEDAEDALSDALLKAYNGFSSFQGSADDLKSWLGRVAYNVCMDMQRCRSRVALQLSVVNEEGALMACDPDDEPEKAFLRDEACRRILETIGSLPPRLRDPLVLRAFDELSCAEIAQRLRITEANARKRLQEARSVLATLRRRYLMGLGAPLPQQSFLSPEFEMTTSLIPWPSSHGWDGSTGPAFTELESKVLDTRVVQVTLPSGAAMEYHIDLGYEPVGRKGKVEALRKSIERYPRGWKKRLDLANLYYAAGDWEQAIEEYCRVLARQSHLLDVWLRLGKTLYLMEDRASARVVYEAARQHARNPATKQYIRGLTELCRQDYGSAVEALEETVRLEPRNSLHWHAMGWAYEEAGRPFEALRAYDEALKLDPDDTVVLTNSHNALAAAGRLREAHSRLARVVELEPNCVLALNALSSYRCAQGLVKGEEGKATRALIYRALKLAPESADVWATLAQFHIRRGQWGKGKTALTEFVKRNPDSVPGWRHYSVWLFYLGHYQDATDAVLKAKALHPRDFGACWWACVVLPYAGRVTEAQQLLEEMLRCHPHRWDTYSAVGMVMAGWMDDLEGACRLSQQALQKQTHWPAAWLLHGEVLASAGNYREAVASLEHGWKLLSLGDSYEQAVSASFALGRSYGSLGDERKAREWFLEMARCVQEWAQADPAVGAFWLGRAMEALGDVRKAVKAYRAALSRHLLYPEREVAEHALSRLTGDAAQARWNAGTGQFLTLARASGTPERTVYRQ